MGTWFALIIFPCVASITLIRASISQKLCVSEKGLGKAQGRLQFADCR